MYAKSIENRLYRICSTSAQTQNGTFCFTFHICATVICKNSLDLPILGHTYPLILRRPKTTQHPTPFYFCATAKGEKCILATKFLIGYHIMRRPQTTKRPTTAHICATEKETDFFIFLIFPTLNYFANSSMR